MNITIHTAYHRNGCRLSVDVDGTERSKDELDQLIAEATAQRADLSRRIEALSSAARIVFGDEIPAR